MPSARLRGHGQRYGRSIWRRQRRMPNPYAALAEAASIFPGFPKIALSSGSELSQAALTDIRTVLNSYYHTNALALAVLSALLEHYDPSDAELGSTVGRSCPPPLRPNCPRCRRCKAVSPEVQGLIRELNEFGEDTDSFLIASMYRHLAYWPPYLAIVRTLLAPHQADGNLNALTRSARAMGRAHGKMLARSAGARSAAGLPASGACLLPAVRRTSDRQDGGNLRYPSTCHARITGATCMTSGALHEHQGRCVRRLWHVV